MWDKDKYVIRCKATKPNGVLAFDPYGENMDADFVIEFTVR